MKQCVTNQKISNLNKLRTRLIYSVFLTKLVKILLTVKDNDHNLTSECLDSSISTSTSSNANQDNVIANMLSRLHFSEANEISNSN